MYYRCTKCNRAHKGLTSSSMDGVACTCGNKKFDRAERAHIIVTGEYYRSAGRMWMWNEKKTHFVDKA